MTTPQSPPSYHHVLLVMVGLSVIDKTLKATDPDRYARWMGEGGSEGQLATFDIAKMAQGEGSYDQLEVEKQCFNLSTTFNSIEREIPRKKRNRYSAEVSSLYMIFKDRGLEPTDCRIVLIATDSAEGIFAARLNKRILACRFLACPETVARHWKNQADDKLHEQSLGRLSIVHVPGLQVQNAAAFVNQGKNAFAQMMQDINATVRGGDKLLNITGGFKGVIPIAIGVAWRYGWDAAYLYEETDQLLYYRRPSWFDVAPSASNGPLDLPVILKSL